MTMLFSLWRAAGVVSPYCTSSASFLGTFPIKGKAFGCVQCMAPLCKGSCHACVTEGLYSSTTTLPSFAAQNPPSLTQGGLLGVRNARLSLEGKLRDAVMRCFSA